MALFTALAADRGPVDEARRDRIFARRFGDRAAEAIAVYAAHHPGLDLDATTAAMETDEVFRWPAWSLAQRRVERGRGPTWMYRFDWATPVLGGGLGACHGVDLPFVFDNLGRPGVELFTGPAWERQRVADAFADALVAFARHGDPGWPAYDATRRATRLIDVECSVVDDPDGDVRRLWAARAAMVG
jgi:para-nitrobenzyl esterase